MAFGALDVKLSLHVSSVSALNKSSSTAGMGTAGMIQFKGFQHWWQGSRFEATIIAQAYDVAFKYFKHSWAL